MKTKWVGSWRVQFEIPDKFRTLGLVTFFEDGNLITSEIPGPQESSGHGSWVGGAANECKFAFLFYLGSAEVGKWQEGSLDAEMVYDPESDVWSGLFTVQTVDQDGGVPYAEKGRMNGTRIGSKI